MLKPLITIALLVLMGALFLLFSDKLNDYAQKGYKKNLEAVGLIGTIFDKPPAEWQFKAFGIVLIALAAVVILIVVFRR
jgi:hypothetical protein